MSDRVSMSSGVVGWFRWVSLAVALLVIVQAGLAGRGFMLGKQDFMDAHEMLANIVFLVGLGLLGLAVTGFRRGMLDKTDLVLSVLMLLLIIGQIGLGYAGEDSGNAASLHWPNGVLITVVAALLAGRSLPRGRSAS
jgi:peptidoglycan/LPS O-acetylase OafA/YrhL